MTLYLPVGPLKPRSGFEPVPTSQLTDDLVTTPSGSVFLALLSYKRVSDKV